MTIVVSVQHPVAAWTVPESAVARLRVACPDHEVINATTDAARAAGLSRADIAFTWRLSAEELQAAPRLRWLHSSAVAVGTLCLDALSARGVAISNSRSIQSTPIAEHVFAMLLAMTRQLPLAIEKQQQAAWAQNAFVGARTPSVLRGGCLGVIGLGSIGAEVARLGAAFGMEVIGLRRDPSRGTPAGVSQVFGPAELDALLARADVVVIAAPLTADTEALFDASRLARLKRGARLVNVARGQLVDSAALVAALASGHLAGAALDVFPDEPLPATHPLWRAPNVLLTPHTSGFRADHWNDVADLFAENVRRWDAGEPVLWPVDPARGY